MEKYKLIAALEMLAIIVLIIFALLMSAKIESMADLTDKIDNKITVDQSVFGQIKETNEIVQKFKLRNDATGFEVNLISYGAAIQSVLVRDKSNKLVNVALGFDNIDEYVNRKLNPYFGGIVGRMANRIGHAEFRIEDKIYKLDKNDGENCLHSGQESFHWKNWQSSKLESGDGVRFSLKSPAGEGGFPGQVDVSVVYKLDSKTDSLIIEYTGKTSEPTPLDLTNHFYFNLEGHNSRKKIYDHHFKIYSNYYLDVNINNLIPTGKLNTVESTKYDFREFARLGDRVVANGAWPETGYDNFFVLDQQTGQKIVASVKNPNNGIKLDIWSNQNGVQFYTANFLDTVKPSNNETYSVHEAFCLETQNFPDAVNKPQFPSAIVRPEGEYKQLTKLSFSVINN